MVHSSITLGVLEWYPQFQVIFPFDLAFPPDTAGLSGIPLGQRWDISFLGPSAAPSSLSIGLLRPPGWSVMSAEASPEEMARTRYIRVAEQVTGWPLPSMYGRVRYRLGEVADPAHGFPWEAPRNEWAVRIPRLGTNYDGTAIPVFDDPILPLRPLLVGTAGNTGFFGLLFFAVWSVVRAVWRLLTGAKKRERARRGECVRCAYPLGDLATCPECGKARRRGGSGRLRPGPVSPGGG